MEDLVDRLLETGGKHLIGLVKAEHHDGLGLKSTSVDHVKDTTGGTDNDVRTLVKPGDVLSDGGTTDTSVAVDVEVVTESDNDLLNLLSKLSGGSKDKSLSLLNSGVDLLDKRWLATESSHCICLDKAYSLENRDGEGSGLTGTGLSLGNAVTSSNDGHDSTLLNSRRSLETVSVDTTEKLALQLHVIEASSFISNYSSNAHITSTHLSTTSFQLELMRSPSI